MIYPQNIFGKITSEEGKSPIDFSHTKPFYTQNAHSNLNYKLTLNSLNEAGFFAIFNAVLGLIDHFNSNLDPYLQAICIDFEKNSFYYDCHYGDNFWEYFFEPISLQNYYGEPPRKEITVADTIPYCSKLTKPIQAPYLSYKGFIMERNHASEIINRYVKIKKTILDKINSYTMENFKEKFVIGIHYRGTDKKIESPRVSYKKMEDALNTYIKNNELKEYKIFIATDEFAFLDYFLNRFPNQVLFTTAERSSNDQAVHKSNYSPYSKGEEALIDCLLLSKCNYLLWTESCLSLNATRFNPELPHLKITN